MVPDRDQSRTAPAGDGFSLPAFLDASPDALTIVGLDGTMQRCNLATAKLLGYDDCDELLGRQVLDLIVPRDRQRAAAGIAEVLRTGGSQDHEYTLIRRDGTEYPVEVSTGVIRGANQEPLGLVTSTKDVSRRRQAEAALRASEQRYRLLFSQASEGIFIMSTDGSTALFNESFARMHGYDSPEEMQQLTLGDLDAPESAKLAPERLRRLLAGESLSFEVEHRHRDRHTFPLGVVCNMVQIDGVPHFLGFHRDLTTVKQAEAKLRESNRLIHAIADNADSLIYLVDREGRFLLANRMLQSMLGRTDEEILGRTREQLLPPQIAAAHQANDLAVIASGRPLTVEETHLQRDGERTFLTVKFPLRDDQGEVYAVGGISNDITARKRAEAESASLLRQLHQAQKMEAIGQLAGGIAHDFNNILAVILGTADQAVTLLPEPGPIRSHLDRIIRVARRARDLTSRLLTFTRREKLEIRSVRADELLLELVDLLKRSLSKQVRIHLDPSVGSSVLSVDLNQMVQALLNVCINAADAMPDGGTLGLACEETTLPGAVGEALPDAAPGRYVRIAISDTGTGMPEHVRSQVFDPFFTTKDRGKGTGLGLPITLAIVQGHGGTMRVESEPGQGTRVEIYLPVAGEPGQARITPEEEPQRSTAPATLLVVDDDRDVLETTTEILRASGFTVIPASGPGVALDLFTRHAGTIDLVILDMMLPEMGGEDVFRALRRTGSQVKVLICSGYSREGKAAQILAEGASAFLQKPFDRRELLQAVTGLLR